ncbi:MAG: hypothetical protein ACYDHW_01445 [Syntrophorhabdaceae bacterium]
MKRILLFIIIAVICIYSAPLVCQGAGQEDTLDKILKSTERFFQVLSEGKYRETWSLLSSKSKDVITEDIYKGSNAQYSREQIRSDLQAGGMIAAGYWKGVLQYFDPKTILEDSKWEAGSITAREAELLITNKKASHPARLKTYYESGEWRVGLVESFWGRKK